MSASPALTTPEAQLSTEEILERRQALEAQRQELAKELAQVQRRMSAVYNKDKRLAEVLEQRALQEQLEKGYDWVWLLEQDSMDSRERQRACVEALAGVSRWQGLTALSSSGYSPVTMQKVVRLSLVKGAPALTEAAAKGLEQVLPAIRFLPAEYDVPAHKMVRIFESTLSERASYRLMVDEQHTVFTVAAFRGSRSHELFRGETLRQALAYIEQNLPYELYEPPTP